MKKLTCLAFCLALLLFLFGCGNINVTINSGNGSDSCESDNTAVVSDSTQKSENSVDNNGNNDGITNINTPKKDGYIFGGWFVDEALTVPATDTGDTSKLFPKWIEVVSKEYHIRNDEATITDSGRRHQKYDTVFLSRDFDYDALLLAGYEYFDIEFSFEIKEEYDGYQYVFLYKDENCVDTSSLDYFVSNSLLGENPDDPSLLCAYRFEHVAGSVGNTWGTYTFKATLKTQNLEDILYIRYGASGTLSDTWLNKNVIIRITPAK